MLLGREHRSLSYLVFWKFQNIYWKFLKFLRMITSGWQKVVKFKHLISKDIYVFWNVFKILYKTINDPIFSNVPKLFTQKTLKGSSKYTWALNVLRHAIPWGTRSLEHLRHLDTQRALGHSRTQDSLGLWH